MCMWANNWNPCVKCTDVKESNLAGYCFNLDTVEYLSDCSEISGCNKCVSDPNDNTLKICA
jgi:hypothetical protein